jgi:myo-inositol-1(or 4)-monophosphatase
MPALADELEFARALAAEAAGIALARAHALDSRTKSNDTFVTDLDLDLERLIRGRLAAAYPDDALTGEEFDAAGGSGPRRWCIDPIDGTGNLVHGLPLWAVSIGLLDRGEPVLGVIALPPLGETFWATKGGGAFRDGQPIRADDAESFHSHDNVGVATNALRALDLRTVPGRVRDLGTACTELTFVSCGRLRASIFMGEQAHDLAAGAVIASEAGCRFADLDGRSLTPAEFVASAPVRLPTFIAPPRRLATLAARVRRRAD